MKYSFSAHQRDWRSRLSAALRSSIHAWHGQTDRRAPRDRLTVGPLLAHRCRPARLPPDELRVAAVSPCAGPVRNETDRRSCRRPRWPRLYLPGRRARRTPGRAAPGDPAPAGTGRASRSGRGAGRRGCARFAPARRILRSASRPRRVVADSKNGPNVSARNCSASHRQPSEPGTSCRSASSSSRSRRYQHRQQKGRRARPAARPRPASPPHDRPGSGTSSPAGAGESSLRAGVQRVILGVFQGVVEVTAEIAGDSIGQRRVGVGTPGVEVRDQRLSGRSRALTSPPPGRRRGRHVSAGRIRDTANAAAAMPHEASSSVIRARAIMPRWPRPD